MDAFEIAGLPLHPLIVHALVVLLPLTALALVLGTFIPAVRRRLGIATPVAALVVLALTPITVAAGEALLTTVGPLPGVEEHAALGRMLLPWAIALFVVSAAQWGWYRFRPRPEEGKPRSRSDAIVTGLLAVLAVAAATGSTTMVVRIGEAGARAVWG
ncbi:hypothetical protein M2317_001607 [Microbacterium sp. ZKA21]|jgi:hypothetical protein|uniref:DUF2231 domain-containing protein n=1 Tax=Microbacterium sp. ZKA21 TaxID=3381694 RepID=UPI003D1D7B01